jgi:hypothetical protein
MKRFVYVPSHLSDDGSLEEAKKLSHDSKLQIMMGVEDDGICEDSVCIISVPSKSDFFCDSTVEVGFIHSIDIINEFYDFDSSVHLVVTSPSVKQIILNPKLKEKHLLRFRNRFYETGKHFFVCKDASEVIYFEGSFEVA